MNTEITDARDRLKLLLGSKASQVHKHRKIIKLTAALTDKPLLVHEMSLADTLFWINYIEALTDGKANKRTAWNK